MNARLFFALIAVATLMACSARTEKAVRNDEGQVPPRQMALAARQSSIPPGRCRIVGTLIAADSVREQGGPCSKAPCQGIVRVDSVLGYGAAFGNPLAVGKEISVRFAFTLAPTTSDLFPTMTDRLPGLVSGDRFEADVEAKNEPAMGGRSASYTIQTYQKKN